MLNYLTIKNVALIRFSEIEFSKGLNVLSGETGAGKSVVLDALNFALGQKADKSMICHGEKDCSVTCSFDITNNFLVQQVLNEFEIDYDNEIVIKRTFNVDGKSSIKLNGESVTASMLRRVTSLLVDVHGQSDHFLLLKETNQLNLVDQLGGNAINHIKDCISDLLKRIKEVDNSLQGLGGDEVERARKLDYLQFAISEIENLNLTENEEEELQEKKKKLLNLEKIAVACEESYSALSLEGGVTDVLSAVARKMSQISNFGKEYSAISSRIEVVLDELNDISELIGDFCDESFSPETLDEIQARLDAISLVKKKYGKSYAELMKALEDFKNSFDLINNSEVEIRKLNEKRAELIKNLEVQYDKLSYERKTVANKLSSDLSDKLKELAMKNAKFVVEFSQDSGEVLSVKGRDSVTFMFTANKGEVLKPLSKIISGGELSRLMLAIKAVTGGNYGTETFIFDEIDAGISGEAAHVVAENFARIAKDKQIIAISHLPQIVSMADVGYLISKNEEDERTVTHVRRLDDDGKVYEVLRLIGGDFNSQAALKHAREMVSKADVFKEAL